MPTIHVDEQIYDFLQQKATPFVDKPNDVLRRLLLDEEPVSCPAIPQMPKGTSKMLRQILGVAYLVRKGIDRKAATKLVADNFQVSVQTVMDKYGRKLGISSISDFDDLLKEEGMTTLKAKLIKTFPGRKDIISQML